MNRREFIGATGAMILVTPTAPWRTRAAARIHFGCAAITWEGNDLAAIDDIAALGFRGIQLRSNIVPQWRDRPDDLRALLATRGLTFVALSSGDIGLDPATRDASIAMHVANARFLRDTGGRYLQVTDQRPKGRAPTPDDCRQMGLLLTDLGRRTDDIGIALGYHNHMGALGQSPDDVARVLDAADPRYVKLELDVAHYVQAGGDPAQAVRDNKDRLLFLHIKDVEHLPTAPGYRFVELGRGSVDLPALFAALEAINYSGWAVVELDSVPDKNRTPKQANAISKAYLERLGYEVSSDGAPRRGA